MYVILFGEIGDIDYVNATGPFATREEADSVGERLQAEGKIPDEDESGGEVAWRVISLDSPDILEPDYGDGSDF